MSRKNRVLLHGAVFAGTLIFLWLLLTGAAAIPNEALKQNMIRSALSYKDRDPFSFENGGKWNAISDNYADVILLNLSWNMGRGDPFLCALDTWYYSGEELGENGGFYLAVTEEDTEPDTDYTRYWHGTGLMVRVCHLFTDVEGMKTVGFAAVLVLALGTAGILAARGHYDMVACLFLSMAAVQIWNIRLSLEYEPAFVICVLLCPLYLILERKGDTWLTCLSVAGGVMTAFFDFLTTETAVILVPLLLVTAVRAREGRMGTFREGFGVVFWCVFCWLLGYGGTFVAKWTAVSLITGENRFRLAAYWAEKRINGGLPGETPSSLPIRMLSAAAANLTVMFGGCSRVEWSGVVRGFLIFLCVPVFLPCLYSGDKRNREAGGILCLLGAAVFVRYLVLSNHSWLHAFFTYRALISPVLAVFLIMALTMEFPGRKR